jgi:hypothetical protein
VKLCKKSDACIRGYALHVEEKERITTDACFLHILPPSNSWCRDPHHKNILIASTKWMFTGGIGPNGLILCSTDFPYVASNRKTISSNQSQDPSYPSIDNSLSCYWSIGHLDLKRLNLVPKNNGPHPARQQVFVWSNPNQASQRLDMFLGNSYPYGYYSYLGTVHI